MEIWCHNFAGIVHFVDGSGFAGYHWPTHCLFFVIDFILCIGGITNINGMKTVVVVASQQGVRVLGYGNAKFVKDAVVLENITQFGFQWLLHWNWKQWFVCFANVPNLHTQVISSCDVLATIHKRNARITRYHLSKEVGLVFVGLNPECERFIRFYVY